MGKASQAMKVLWPMILLVIGLVMIVMATAYGRKNGEPSVFSEMQADQVARPQGPEAQWVINPDDPGQDVPAVGRSLFDYVVTERQGGRMVYRVPFPFTALVQRIEYELGSEDRRSPLKRVLIPLNRSLQRHAAKPEYFTYPRAVVAVDTEPSMRAGSSGLFLKDRLFLGYQEKAEILEVISYNETAGRFEFQVVRDYGPGKTPKVLYANRALCTACHQNQSPIFSRPLWEETNANPTIATLLEQQRADFYRFPLHQGIDIPNAIDEATDRANELSAYQLVWREGCEQVRSPEDSVRCRADLFRFLLQSRLTGVPPALNQSTRYREHFLPRMVTQWKAKWPHGLRIPNPDLLNRNPLDGAAGERAKIRSMFEPTIPREPSAVWSISTATLEPVDRVIAGLSGFLADIDSERLDRFLSRQVAGFAVPVRRYDSRCEADVRARSRAVDRVVFRCREPESGEAEGGFSMEGVLYVKAGAVINGTIDRLSTGHGNEVLGLKVAGGTLISKAGRHSGRMSVVQQKPSLSARLADGRGIKELTFAVGGLGHDGRAGQTEAELTGSAVMTVVEDYAAVDYAIDRMARETLTGKSDVFARKPFRRAGVMKALWSELGMPSLRWCCERTDDMPPAVAMTDQGRHDRDGVSDDRDLPPVLKVFHRYCAQCHHEDLPFPPNFLHGTPERVQAHIHDCAERILFRLEMWSLGSHERPEAPMPPAGALRRLDLSPQQWTAHSDLALLKSYSAGLVASPDGKPVRFETLAANGYDNLRACLPSGGSTVAAGGAKRQ
jgi:hypothetical protein